MLVQYFKCTLLSDVVLNSTAATEGQQTSLDYIPGANFLGIAASRLYDQLSAQEAHDIFHSGKFRFSDAHISHDGELTYKVPLSWFFAKGDSLSDHLYIHHLNENKERIQFKQARSGYFSLQSRKLLSVNKDFSLKSAYDAELRKAKEGRLFGYEALKQGQYFIFKISSEDKQLMQLVSPTLIGKQRLGRSRTAQYGLVQIEPIDINATEESVGQTKQQLILYAKTDWCFYNQYGMPTLQPCTQQHLELPIGAKIDWAKSQIRTRSYAPWNGKRHTRDADRHVIEKGSVVIVDIKACESPVGTGHLADGIGMYKAEGLGEVWLNPPFLNTTNSNGKLDFTLTVESSTATIYYPSVSLNNGDKQLIDCVKKREHKDKSMVNHLKIVNKFISENKGKYKKISNSQWGAIRNYAAQNTEKAILQKELFGKDNELGYLNHGIYTDLWEQNGRIDLLRHSLDNNFRDYIDAKIKLTDEEIPELVEKLAATFQKK